MARSVLTIVAALLLAGSPTGPRQPIQRLEYPTTAKEEFVQAFSQLARLDTSSGTLLYRAEDAEVVNIKRGELPPNHQLFVDDGLDMYDVVLVSTRINGADSARHYVVFTEGPSGDYGFYVVRARADVAIEERTGGMDQIPGEVLAIPGDGSAYSFNRTNSTFAKRRKWAFTDGAFRELAQPFYLVGLKSVTLRNVTVFGSRLNAQPVAQLSEGTKVQVLLTDDVETGDGIMYLISTPSGLVGWIRVPVTQYRGTVIAGLFYWGD